MLQNSVSLSDTPKVVEAMTWLIKAAETDSVVMLHEAMDEWAQLTAAGFETIKIFEHDFYSPIRENIANRLVQLASEKAASGRAVYTVWWVDGRGWYGMPELPPQFIEVKRFCNIAVYKYARSRNIASARLMPT